MKPSDLTDRLDALKLDALEKEHDALRARVKVLEEALKTSSRDPQNGPDRTVAADRPFTVERLAEHWECSPHHIRKMLADGRLAGFKLGGKLWRIPIEEVEKFERAELRQATGSDDSKENTSSSDMRARDAAAIALARMIQNRSRG